MEWFGPGFGWTISKRVAEWFDKEYERYCHEKKLKVQAHARFGGLLRYEERLDSTIDNLTSS